jgi:prepilin-type N-terminal cleavage/methylation domain-containing protein
MSLFSNRKRGFTLAELVVTMGIVVTILTIVLLNQSNYTDGAALGGLTDEVSSAVTQAQVYGISVKELGTGSNDFSASYGVEFRLPEAGGTYDAYILFADRLNGGVKNMQYDSGWSCPTDSLSECLSKIPITRGNKIKEICTIRTGGNDICNIDKVDISFARPATEAQIKFFNNGGNPYSPANIVGVKITFESPKGLNKSVLVYTTGQVSVE